MTLTPCLRRPLQVRSWWSAGAPQLWALDAALVAASAALAVGLVSRLSSVPAPVTMPWWLLAVLFGLTEAFVVHLHFHRTSNSVSLNDIPLVLGLFLSSPTELVLAQLVGAAAVLGLHRRQVPVKLVFNLANLSLSAGLAAAVFHGVLAPTAADGWSRWPGWVGALLGALAASAVSCLLIGVAISLSEGSWQMRRIPRVLAFTLGTTAMTGSVALVAVALLRLGTADVTLLLVPTLAMVAAFRIYNGERHRHQRMELLHEASLIFQRSADLDHALALLLERVRDLFRGQVAAVAVLSRGAQEREHRRVDGDGDDPLLHGQLQTMLAEAAGRQGAALLRAHASGVSWDAMVAPLRSDGQAFGAILVTHRLPDVPPFNDEDLRLFETFVRHASISLENGRLERELKHQAFHDPLTNLANRALFADRLEHALARTGRDGRLVAVLYLDLDDFKLVNDSLGHSAGDELLVAVAGRLQRCLRPFDTAARLGGDEFAILLEETHDAAEATVVAERVIAALEMPFSVQGTEVLLRASIGVVTGAPETSAEMLLQHADVAMYRAKLRRSGGYEVFEPSMQEAVNARHELKADLQRALERGELLLHYQPIVALQTGEVTGVEALVRWRHPLRGLVSPLDFMPLAEETGLVVPIGAWVLEQACLQAASWQRGGGAGRLTMNVNISSRQLQDARTVDAMVAIVRQSPLSPSDLVIEITESVLLDDMDMVVGSLERLRALGVRVAIDDFGTGYSSLNYLRRLPIDVVKIDKTFVAGIATAHEDRSLTLAIVRLLDTLDVETVVEGVEKAEQLAYVRAMGCDRGQGYLFSRPLPAEALIEVLAGAELPGAPGPRLGPAAPMVGRVAASPN